MFCSECGNRLDQARNFCQNCGKKIESAKIEQPQVRFDSNSKINKKRPYYLLVIIIFITVIFYFSFKSNYEDNQIAQEDVGMYDQNQITASVVNIFCPSTESEDESSGGSGTIISEDGLILTNSHIIPQDETYLHVDDDGCLVVLPDPTTGQPEGIYLASPIVLPQISDNYDLAYMKIYAGYYDEDSREYLGEYPREFPTFDDTTRCKNENIRLGESVRIFGYPAISGGYSLTITDGVVSSFPGAGLIVTSAKISHGNSGGLAIDKYGCMIGIPSLVSSDETESLGVIYSMELIWQFDDEVTNYLNNL